MPFVDLYPEGLNTEGDAGASLADQVIYRLGLKRLAIPGLPRMVGVGEVEIHFVVGPIRTQHTVSRQRPGLPFVFDKHMRRAVPVGENDLLTVCQLKRDVPSDIGSTVNEWRSTVRSALGLLCATLDERIAGEQMFEDLMLLAGGEPIAGGDVHTEVRTFMPFDVTDGDREALARLGDQDLALERDVARAAGYYWRGVSEGPSPDGLLWLWLAVDALAKTRKTQKQAIASALAEVGFDLDWLQVELGRLVGLRGNVAHGRNDDPELLRAGYYDTEGIARALIAGSADIAGWPAMPTATAFPVPLGPRLAREAGQWDEVWHDVGLPVPDDDPEPSGLERADAALGGHDHRIVVDGTDDEQVKARLRFWATAAVEASGIDIEPFSIVVGSDGSLPPDTTMATNVERILVEPALAEPSDEMGEVRLAYLLSRSIGEMHVMRIGVVSDGLGALLIELAGAFAGYREWVIENEMPPEFIHRGSFEGASMQDLGAYVGIALAGDAQSRTEMEAWLGNEEGDNDLRTLVRDLVTELNGVENLGPILEFIGQIADEVRALQDDTH